MQLGRTLTGPPRSAAGTDDGRNRVDEGQQLGRVVCVDSGEAHRQRDTVAIHHEVVLGTGLAPIRRVRAGGFAPLFARTLRLSTLVRLQSTAASSPSQFKSRSCSASQTPATCQSRRRRQHVVPLPKPSSLGNRRQGQPVRRTKAMPPKAARSGTRGRPPPGLGGCLGSSGSIASQRSSVTRAFWFIARMMPRPAGFETSSEQPKRVPWGTRSRMFKNEQDDASGGLARLSHRPHAACADMKPRRHAVYDQSLVLNIGSKVTIRASLRKTYVLAERLCLSADITFPGHGGSPFKSHNRGGETGSCSVTRALVNQPIRTSRGTRQVAGVKSASPAGRRHFKPLS